MVDCQELSGSDRIGACALPGCKDGDTGKRAPAPALAPSSPPALAALVDQLKLVQPPASTFARVRQARIPNAYDKTALRLNVSCQSHLPPLATNESYIHIPPLQLPPCPGG